MQTDLVYDVENKKWTNTEYSGVYILLRDIVANVRKKKSYSGMKPVSRTINVSKKKLVNNFRVDHFSHIWVHRILGKPKGFPKIRIQKPDKNLIYYNNIDSR